MAVGVSNLLYGGCIIIVINLLDIDGWWRSIWVVIGRVTSYIYWWRGIIGMMYESCTFSPAIPPTISTISTPTFTKLVNYSVHLDHILYKMQVSKSLTLTTVQSLVTLAYNL